MNAKIKKYHITVFFASAALVQESKARSSEIILS